MIKIKNIKIVAGMLLTLGCGMLIGSYLQNNTNNTQTNSLSKNNQIAVVNLDEGTTYKNEQKNFAREIVNQEGNSFVLTGLNDAKEGMNHGKYAGYLILPSNFSKNMLSINNNPQKSLVKYEISKNLNPESKDITWAKITKLKETLNEDVGYIYIKSILNDFHKGQDNAKDVLKNDKLDKEVIMSVSDMDLIKVVDLGKLKTLENKVENINIDQDINKNKQIIAQVKEKYNNYLTTADKQMQKNKEESKKVNEDNNTTLKNTNELPNILDNKNNITISLDNSNKKLTEYTTNNNKILQSAQDKLTLTQTKKEEIIKELQTRAKTLEIMKNNKNVDATTEFKNILNDVETKIQNNNYTSDANVEELTNITKDENIIQNYIYTQLNIQDYTKISNQVDLTNNLEVNLATNQNVQNSLNDFAKIMGLNKPNVDFTIKEYMEEYQNTNMLNYFNTKIIGNVKNAIQSNSKKEIENYSDQILKEILEQVLQKANENIQVLNKIEPEVTSIPEYKNTNLETSILNHKTLNSAELKTTIEEDLKQLDQKQKEEKNQIIETLKTHMKLNAEEVSNLEKFKYEDFIENDKIEILYNMFTKQNEQMKTNVETNNQKHIEFATKTKTNADSQINKIMTNMQEQKKTSNAQIEKGLKNVKNTKELTSKENQEKLNGLINKLAYTRKNNHDNEKVYDLINNPIDSKKLESENQPNTNNQTTNNNVMYVGAGIVVLSLITLIYMLLKNKKLNKK